MDLTEYIEAYKKFAQTPNEYKHLAYIEFCKFYIEKAESDEISKEDAAMHLITGFNPMKFKDEINKIIKLCLILEYGIWTNKKEERNKFDKNWDEFVNLVNSIPNKLPST